MNKQKEFKVWVEFERIIEADSQDDAEVIFGDELKIEDIIINSQEVKDEIKKKIEELFEKKKVQLKELGLPLEDWWGESEIFSVNELQEILNSLGDEEDVNNVK